MITDRQKTRTVIRNGIVMSTGGTLEYMKYEGGGNLFYNGGGITDDDNPATQQADTTQHEDNTKYNGFTTSILDWTTPARKTLPPEDYRFVDADTYELTHPEKWYGYKKGTRVDNKWYWQKPDGMWIDENNNEVGYYLGMPGAKTTRLDTEKHNKNVEQYMKRLPPLMRDVLFQIPGIGPLVEEHTRNQLNSAQEGEMPETKTNFDFRKLGTLGIWRRQFLHPAEPFRESIASKKLLNQIREENPEQYEALYNAVPRPARVYTEKDFSTDQLSFLDSLVRNSFKRHNGYYPNVLLGDTLSFPINSTDYAKFLGEYANNSGFWGTLKRSFNPKGSVETSVGEAPVTLYRDGYTIGGGDTKDINGEIYDFNYNQSNYRDQQTYSDMSTWARRGGIDSIGHAETNKDPDIFKQRFLIKRKFK